MWFKEAPKGIINAPPTKEEHERNVEKIKTLLERIADETQNDESRHYKTCKEHKNKLMIGMSYCEECNTIFSEPPPDYY